MQSLGVGDGVGGMEPRAADTWNLSWGEVCKGQCPADPGQRTLLGRTGQGGQMQAGRGSHILILSAHVWNFTFPFIYFFFLNPVSFPEAPNLLFNIGLCD